jgi:putative membrane-bound dehydrogenase-like protein
MARSGTSFSRKRPLGLLLSLALFQGLAMNALGQLAPEESARRLKPAEGLEVTLWAAEPLLVNPTTIDIDSRGRVWVTEGLNYRLTRGGNRQFERIQDADKIKILEDTDHDGKADKVKVFADNIFPVPMGIAVEEFWSRAGGYLGCKVYVGNSPDLLVLEDTNGDDQADKRYPLLTGFGGIDSDHGVHGMTLGPDGKLYFTHGDGCCSVQEDKSEKTQNFSVTDRSGRQVATDQLGTVLRCNRDGTEFEILATRLRNDYECAVDSYGNVFASDNDDDGNRGSRVLWIVDGGVYGYRTPGSPRHWGEEFPGNIPKLAGTGNGSPCGVMVYEGGLLPPLYRGALLEAEAGPRVINAFPLKRYGAGFRTEQKIMLSSEDEWFRPVDVCAAPDGSVFVADWYDGGVGGHAFKDQTTGRIYRLAPAGSRAETATLDLRSVAGLIKASESPNLATRDVARRMLIERANGSEGRDELDRELEAWGKSTSGMARMLWIASAMKGPSPLDAIKSSLRDSPAYFRSFPPPIRELFVRVVGRDNARLGVLHTREAHPPRSEAHLAELLKLVDDPDPGVRRELLLASRDMPTERVRDALVSLARSWDGKDRYYLEALGLAVRNRESEFISSLFDGQLYGELDLPAAGKSGQVALPPYFPVDRNEAYLRPEDTLPPASPLSKTLGLAWALKRVEALPLVARLMPSLTSAELQQAAAEVIQQVVDPRGAEVLAQVAAETRDPDRRVQLLTVLARKLEGDWRAAAGSDAVKRLVDQALAAPSTRLAAISIIAAGGDPAPADQLVELVTRGDEAPEIRAAALEALARVRHGKVAELVNGLLVEAKEKGESSPAAEAAVRSFFRIDGDAADRLRELLLAEDAPLGLRREALRTLASRRDGAERLLAMARENTLPEALRVEAGTTLRMHPDRDIREAVEKAMPLASASGRPLPSLFELVRREGDAERGREVFFKGGTNACGSCHRVQGRGQWIGPDLSTIGVKYGRRELLEHVLNPSAGVAFNFRTLVVAANDGRVLSGLPIEETQTQVTLKTAEGRRERIALGEIESRRYSDVSLMPDGLAQSLTEQELVDMLEFLTTLKEPVSIAGEAFVAGPYIESQQVARGLAQVDPSEPVRLINGKSAPWRKVTADVEGRLPVGAGEDGSSVTLVSIPIRSPEALPARLVIESEGLVEVVLNGEALEASSQEQGLRTAAVTLREGANALLLAVRHPKVEGLVVTLAAASPLEFRAASDPNAKAGER